LAANAEFDLTGSYSDPDQSSQQSHGTQGSRSDGAGKNWELLGKVKADTTILLDFSPKGGPSNLKGKWKNPPQLLEFTGLLGTSWK
jgi:hypothetical protein